ncbi:MAG: GIY-YIG nuclease family protein [Chitinophagaceae bacterium]|nr:GIY-YIG nuclease family protein [Chitinophagaceae bacterium]
MANVYILYSKKLNRYYTGSCLDLEKRFGEHQSKSRKDSFTSKGDDWELFFWIGDLEYKQARKIEAHVKKLRSRKYIEDLKKFSEMSEKLIIRYR